jgi:hypothetical protein
MALSTYSELKTSIGSWLNRDDLTDQIPDFINFAEKQMQRQIRHYKMVERSSGELDSQYSAVPADWLETIRFSITSGDGFALQLTTINDLIIRRQNSRNANGRPQFYAHIGESFELFPTPDAAYIMELVYYQEIPALSDSQTTNWLLTDAPDAYVYGALTQAAPFLGEDERLPTWAQLYTSAIQGLNSSSDRAKQSSAGMRIQVNSY